MMKKDIIYRNKFRALLFISLAILSFSCVKEIAPDIEIYDTDKYVVSGILTDIVGDQEVVVSKTSPVDKPSKIFVSNCNVKAIREDGAEYVYFEQEPGVYIANIDAAFIDKNQAYKIQVKTPDGIVIESRFENYTSAPDIGDIYWFTKDIPSSDVIGYQFYTDMHASELDSRYYLYEIIETYEHHSPYPLEYWWNGQLNRVVPPDYSKMYCWVTSKISDVYPLSTKEFSVNEYDEYKLNFTTNYTQKLQHTYSLLLKQYSTSEEAYNYWAQMRKNLHQSGGMYNSQPIAVKGNLKSISGSDAEVLGFFGVSSLKEKRIFVPPSPFKIIDNSCTMRILRYGYREILWSEYPAYIYSENGIPQRKLMSNACVDCTFRGGYLQKPDFWP